MERWRWFGDGAMGMWVREMHFNRIGARVGEVFWSPGARERIAIGVWAALGTDG